MSDTTTPQEPPSTNNMRYWDEFGRGNDSVCNRDYDTAISQRNHWKDRAERAERERDEAKDGWYQANGVADLAMKHRDMAEQEAGELRALLREAMRRAPNHEYVCASDHGRFTKRCDCGMNDLRARVEKALEDPI